MWRPLSRPRRAPLRVRRRGVTMAQVTATLYVLPASHPSVAAALMLDRKGIEYKRVAMVAVMSKAQLRAMGFPGVTVPALKIDGRKVQGSTSISRELDRLQPEPPLFP